MLCRAPSCLLRNLFQRALSTYCSQSIAFKIFNVLLALFVVRRLIFLIHFIEGIIVTPLEIQTSWETNGAPLKKYTKATGTPMIV